MYDPANHYSYNTYKNIVGAKNTIYYGYCNYSFLSVQEIKYK